MLEWLRDDPGGFLAFMLYRAPAVLIALSFHELAHGYVAYLCGDPTAKMMGRLTLNPLKHLDPIGTVGMFLMGVGWAKPVPVNPANLKNGRWDDVKVSLAGVTTNFVLFLLATLVAVLLGFALYHPDVLRVYGMKYFLDFRSPGFVMQIYPEYAAYLEGALKTPWLMHIQRFIFQLALVNLGMCLFNLLPIPPLDGFHVVNDILLKGRIHMGGQVFRFMQLGLLVLLFTTNIVGDLVSKALYAVQGFILPLALFPFGLS